jgi:hypothetical protein
MFGLAVLVGAAQEHVVSTLKAGTPTVKRWSGLVLIGVGLWLLSLAIWADFFERLFPV